MALAGWEAYVHENFPGFLLPDAYKTSLDAATASRFLGALTGRPDQYELICYVSIVAVAAEEIHQFATRWLPDLIRNLPSQSVIVRKDWRGGFQGRLDVPATLSARASGASTSFVTRERRRSFDLPETLLLKSVTVRLAGVLESLRRKGVTADYGWSSILGQAEGLLRDAALRSRLAAVPIQRIAESHRQAARTARHPAYRTAAMLERRFRSLIDQPNPTEAASVVAQGALTAVAVERRFELAVLLRLVESFWNFLRTRRGETWSWERSLVAANRDEVAMFRETGGCEVAV